MGALGSSKQWGDPALRHLLGCLSNNQILNFLLFLGTCGCSVSLQPQAAPTLNSSKTRAITCSKTQQHSSVLYTLTLSKINVQVFLFFFKIMLNKTLQKFNTMLFTQCKHHSLGLTPQRRIVLCLPTALLKPCRMSPKVGVCSGPLIFSHNLSGRAVGSNFVSLCGSETSELTQDCRNSGILEMERSELKSVFHRQHLTQFPAARGK